MRKCLTATATKGVFKQNAIHPQIFDLQTDEGINFPFTYFRLTSPYSPALIRNKAVYVAESHRNNKKILFTGLRQTTANGIYSGDMLNPETKQKSLILFKLDKAEKQFMLYFFPNRYPKSLRSLINELLTRQTTGEKCVYNQKNN